MFFTMASTWWWLQTIESQVVERSVKLKLSACLFLCLTRAVPPSMSSMVYLGFTIGLETPQQWPIGYFV